jgi:Subtilase family/Repeat of unknown function (DUF5648)
MERELIVMVKPETGLRATSTGVASVMGADVSPLSQVLAGEGIILQPLFGVSEERLQMSTTSIAMTTEGELPDLSIYYRVKAPDESLDRIASRLQGLDTVEAAYIKPAAEPPLRLNDMLPSAEDAPPITPDFTSRQGYLDAAPGGIDARYAWTIAGGRGAGVRIIDIEGAWRFTHEDLLQNQGGVVGGTQSGDIGWRNHGTAVVGEFGGDGNGIGITGICPDASVRAISIFGIAGGSSGAIRQAADLLGPGDIILIELHRPGPRADGVGQRGYIAIEWWPDDFDAIRYATAKGVIVVEAAGNGSQNLDDPIYNQPAPGFPSTWTNPFNRSNRDSGAIVVGAGAPPPGTHGRNWGADRSRLDFSNYGALIDAQGWGREVTTCGYGDLQGGGNEDIWYTDQFSGTSSASPIVVGALGSIQGVLRARNQAPLSAAAARNWLRTTGSPQQDGQAGPQSQRIGNRPNLREIIARLVPTATVALYRYWNPTIGDHFYTTNWSELGSGRYGWNYEGVQCYVFGAQRAGTVPLYRYWNPTIGDHFYTSNWSELGGGRYGWNYEGVQCYVYPGQQPEAVPLYRYWNPTNTDHFYTTNWSELGGGRYGWNYEGVQGYVLTRSIAGASVAEATPSDASFSPGTGTLPETFAPGGTGAIPDTFAPGGERSPARDTIPDTFVGQGERFSPSSERSTLADSFTTDEVGEGIRLQVDRMGKLEGATISIRFDGNRT